MNTPGKGVLTMPTDAHSEAFLGDGSVESPPQMSSVEIVTAPIDAVHKRVDAKSRVFIQKIFYEWTCEPAVV